ncbi:MAG TPA: sn-glycerol-3-phosphate ABC transporter ATP-binding protein UgpC [Casimicrobiaceae bacterium]|nr:sn-glycerol-3-phosphate ABC transporter ATP-binding protein UgpC [Casimicrobiaceae bacterium]
MARISLRNIEKRYDDVVAVADCSLEIADREFVVLVGPSGSGKTTLLRIIAGLEHVSAGDVLFDDVRVNDVDVGDRDIAMVFQNYGLYPHMTVYDNMAFGLRRRDLPRAAIDERVRRTAVLLAIEPLLARRPRQLSGGQRQRVALGRAIVRDPAVFLLDEPLSNLDAHLRVQMRAEILKVHRAVTATAVYVTHDQVEALTMGDRIVVMSGGRIQQVGTPGELYDRPANQFVASFIGTPAMGFLTCRLERSGGSLRLAGGGVHARLPAEPGLPIDVPDGGPVIIAIRPERLALSRGDERADADVVVQGSVEVVEMLGSEQYVHVRVPAGSVTARVPRDEPVRIDDRVTLTASARHLHVFDAETGASLAYPQMAPSA